MIILRHQFDHLLNQSGPSSHEFVEGLLQSIEMPSLLQHDHEFQLQSVEEKNKY